MRVLGAIRQSKTRDHSISPEGQRAAITAWSLANDHQVTKFTEDLSRSGGVSAFKRPSLGSWLSEPARISAWDILVTTKLDRACRDARDYLRLRDWCSDHGKLYVSLAENLDMTTAAGRMFGTVTAAFAEAERERASERRLETLEQLREQGRWPGGRIPYGWRKHDTGRGWILVPDDDGTADIVRTIVGKAIASQSNGQIQRWLNSNGHRTTIGKEWSIESVRQILHSPGIAGLLTDTQSAQLRFALRSRSQTRGERVGGHMLLRVAYCRQCGNVMYGNIARGKRYRGYYRCTHCGIYVRMERLEAFTERSLLSEVGSRPLTKRQVVPGDDHSKDIARLEGQLESVRDIPLIDTTPLEAELARLRDLPYEADRIERIPTGQTVAEHWAGLDQAGKGHFLREWGVMVEADRTGATLRLGWLDTDGATFPLPL